MNNAFHSGLGWGLSVVDSETGMMDAITSAILPLEIKFNIIFGQKQKGLVLETMKNGLVDGNYVIATTDRIINSASTLDDLVAFEFCRKTACLGTRVINNVVAGYFYVGYWIPAQKCPASGTDMTASAYTDTVIFYNNILHSGTDHGVVVTPNLDTTQSDATCMQAGFTTAYKINGVPFTTYFAMKKIGFVYLKMFDNTKGVSLNIADSADDQKTTMVTFLNNSIFYGELDTMPDCPSANYCTANSSHWSCGLTKASIMLPLPSVGSEGIPNTSIVDHPYYYPHLKD
jgi:hypothetical protein